MCERAVERLLEFSHRPRFKRAVQNAFEAFWSPEFLQLPDDEASRIMTSPEAETSMVTYMTLDAPATRCLCAVYCSPELIRPAMWLPLVWGDDPPEFSTDAGAQSVIRGVFKLGQEIANALAEATFEPLLPRRPGPGMDNVAQAQRPS
jgi:yecA family protein